MVSPFFSFFFNDTATTEIYTLSLHDALPILRGAPVYSDASVTPSRRLEVRGLALDASGIRWPAGPPAQLQLGVDLPGAGTLAARGTVGLATRALELAVELKDAALAPYGP